VTAFAQELPQGGLRSAEACGVTVFDPHFVPINRQCITFGMNRGSFAANGSNRRMQAARRQFERAWLQLDRAGIGK